MAVSGSINASKGNIDSTYASVTEQSGIQAGDGGFQINVAGNTDLKGAVIASSDQAIADGKNGLVTQTLTIADIQNSAQATANNSGISLSSDMFTQGKYGVAKGVIGNLLNNGSESGASSGATLSAVGKGDITITDDAKQKELTGKTGGEMIASLNRDTANANTVAARQDVEALKESSEAAQAIKQTIFNEAIKLTDELYRKVFLHKAEMYELVKDQDGKQVFDEKGVPVKRVLSNEEKRNLKASADGKIHVANNGIFNDENAAAKYANQRSTTDGPQYLIHFPEANNIISELLIAGYQKYLESDLAGLANATEETKKLMLQYGQTGLHIDGHSRGAMTTGNALESLQNQANTQSGLSGTTINFFCPAYNAEKADGILSILQNRDGVLDPKKQNEMVLQMQNHFADPVGRLIGNNPGTGGTIPEGSSTLVEAIRVLGGEITVHNCYGKSENDACRERWNDSPNNQPVLQKNKTHSTSP